MVSSPYIEIQADDPARAADFYAQVFGWKCKKLDGMPIEYWQIGENEGGILKRPCEKPPEACGTNAFCCSFQVSDFDQCAALVQKIGGRIAMAKFPIPGKCWQGYFIDTEGNTFGAYQVDPKAGMG